MSQILSLPVLESLAGRLATAPTEVFAIHWYIPSLLSPFRLCLKLAMCKFVPSKLIF
jgi:hypothetical protein